MRTSRGRPDLETGQRLFTEYMLYTTLYVQALWTLGSVRGPKRLHYPKSKAL